MIELDTEVDAQTVLESVSLGVSFESSSSTIVSDASDVLTAVLSSVSSISFSASPFELSISSSFVGISRDAP